MPGPESDTEDFIVVDSSPVPPPPQPKPTPKKPTVAAAKTPTGKKTQIKPDILPNEAAETPPKRKRGRPPKIRPFNDEFRPFNEELPAPAPKKQKTTKTEAAYVYKGPPVYLLDSNRKDVFADPGRVKVEEDGTVRPIDGSATSNFKPVEKVLHETGHSELGHPEASGSDIRPASPASPPPVPVKPNNHRYLHINEPVYMGADPRRYRKKSPKTPTPPRPLTTPWPDPPSDSVSRGTDAPGIADLKLKYDAKYIPNGLRIPTLEAVEKTKSVERAALGNGGYDEFAPLPNAVRGFATSFERSTGGVVDAGAQTTDKEGRPGWVPWE